MVNEQTTLSAIPDYRQFMQPCLEVMQKASGPMSNDEIDEAVAAHMGLGEQVLAVLRDPDRNPKPEAFYRLSWARSYLKKVGLVDNPLRGSWVITERGRAAAALDPNEIVRLVASGADADSISAQVPDAVAEELLAIYARVVEDVGGPNGDELAAYYARFRQKFGPEILRNTSGEALLRLMHGRGVKDSLVYWLEFKNDDELPGMFGSIAGGSALKFGIYQSTDTQFWMSGHPQNQKKLSTREAIALVEKQRDQLLAGCEVLSRYSSETADYEELQARMNEAAPDLADKGWAHKYFALLFSRLLDDYHNLGYQQYHLIRLHKLPGDGLFVNARFFVGIARQLEIPVTHLGTVLNARHGNPKTVWRVGTTTGRDGSSEWPRMRAGGFAAIGWTEIGDLSAIEHNSMGKAHVRQLLETHLPGHAAVRTKAANQLFAFATRVSQGETIVAMEGQTVRGVGEVTGDYYFDSGDGPFAHRRPVRWRDVEEWKLPRKEALFTTFVALKQHANLVELARRLDTPGGEIQPPAMQTEREVPKPRLAQPLAGLLGRIQSALVRKGQVILYGPPGTGKTHWANRAMEELGARSWFGRAYSDLTDAERGELAAHAIARCTFHPAYGYEDFLVGYRPVLENGTLAFVPKRGVFAALCSRAAEQPERQFYLLVDEINRGDIPRIFGELLTVLERDKRGLPVILPLLDEPFVVPSNVALIGTMNTADRSIALLDAALRRRFAFIELMPDSGALKGASVEGLPLGAWLDALNRRVIRHAGRDSRNLQVGHSYLMSGTAAIELPARFVEVLRDDIVPLLQEYCYDDFDALRGILGPAIVLAEQKRIDESLFEPARRNDLFAALLAEFEGITATSAAADADISDEDEESDDDTGEDEAGA